jgi:hypothetical protein
MKMKEKEAIKDFWKRQSEKAQEELKKLKLKSIVEWERLFPDRMVKGEVVGFGLKEGEPDLFDDGGKRMVQVKCFEDNKIHTVNVRNLILV